MPAKPMLGDLELQLVQNIDSEGDEVLAEHSVPALEGDFLQGLGRRAERVTLTGVITGPEAGDGLKSLREKLRGAAPVSFVADIATATKVDKVLIEEMGVRELGGKPERFEYAFSLREFLPPPPPQTEQPPPPPPPPIPPPLPSLETGTLVVEVVVEGQSDFDFSKVTVTVDGTKEDGTLLSQALTNRSNNVWTETNMPPGQFTVSAVVTDPPMSGSAAATIGRGQTAHVTITLRPGAVIAKAFIVHFRFDKAFVEPCMREVLQQVAEHAANNTDEKLLIVGHTDKTGSNQYNQSLSERRARSVYAYLAFGRDQTTSEVEWNQLRQRALGGLPQLKDTWGTRQYQHMLQDLGFYAGNVDGDHGLLTDGAVRSYREAKRLPPGTIVDDAVWGALIHDYLLQDSLAVPESQFLANAKDGCDGGILKWLGCGEEQPLPLPSPSTEDPHRPYRRVEMLFVRAERLPCDVPQPDTFNLPAAGAVASTWCLGPGNPANHCCFATRECKTAGPGQWCITPAEAGSFIVRGSIQFEDGTPATNIKYVLISPDGEYMDGEAISGARRGDGIFGRTKDDGTFEYPDNPKGPGIYTMEITGPFIAHLAEDPPGFGKGNVVCKRLDGTSDFNITLSPAETGDPSRRLRATIFDRFGEVRERTEVQVLFSDGTQGKATTNDKGEFVIEMNNPQEIGKIRYQISDDPNDVLLFADFFVDVKEINTEEGIRRRLHNLGYPADEDLSVAITSFQATHGLDTTGEADDAMRAKLASVHDGAEPPVPIFTLSEKPADPAELNDAGPPL